MEIYLRSLPILFCSVYEREALMFLYAYMPIGDVTDYPGDYYLENVRLSKQTRDEDALGQRDSR